MNRIYIFTKYTAVIIVLIVFALVTFTPDSKAEAEYGDDYLRYLLPLYATGYAAWKEKSYKGPLQAALSIGSAQLTTEILKKTVNRKRPQHKEGAKQLSFPSGHASAGFSSAMFIHRRYGIKEAAVPYVLAAWTGYARIQKKRHYVTDVIGSLAVSGIFTWICVRPYEPETNEEISLNNMLNNYKTYSFVPQAYVSGDGIYVTFMFSF
jgi:membrane-associated phospholipid phosphatase